MEPLKVLEVNDQGGEVQLRSQSPTPRADQRAYYEMRLFRQGSLRMERFAFDETTRQRRQVPCQLTRETLERLADDIAATVGQVETINARGRLRSSEPLEPLVRRGAIPDRAACCQRRRPAMSLIKTTMATV